MGKEVEKLQSLCNKYSWPLVRALGSAEPEAGFDFFSNKTFPGNQRLLDPSVKASFSLNVTFQKDSNDTFWRLSKEAADVWQHSPSGPSPQQLRDWWAQLMAHQIQVAPITARSCNS